MGDDFSACVLFGLEFEVDVDVDVAAVVLLAAGVEHNSNC